MNAQYENRDAEPKKLLVDEMSPLSINILNQVQSQNIISTLSLKWSHCSQFPTDEANS